MNNKEYWKSKLKERQTRLCTMLQHEDTPQSMISTECILVLIALHQGPEMALAEVAGHIANQIKEREEYNLKLLKEAALSIENSSKST